MKKHTIYECSIDNRVANCSCGEPKCIIGLSFDSDPEVARLIDKYGNEHCMYLDVENIDIMIDHLRSARRIIVKNNKKKK